MAVDDGGTRVPVWTIGTEVGKVGVQEAAMIPEDGITPERLAQLRDGLAAFLDTPLVTLEAYPLPTDSKIPAGQLLEAVTPLAQSLTSLIQQSSGSPIVAPVASAAGEVLYRMVVPTKVAVAMGTNIARSMPSAAVPNGIRSPILGRVGIVGQATFVPVAAEAAVLPAGGMGLLTIAAPLVWLAISTASAVYAQEQQRIALQRVTELLEDLKQAQLEAERDGLMASSKAVDKATAVLLDEGRIKDSLGLSPAVHTIDTAFETATRRAQDWQRRFAGFADSGASVVQLKKAYPGIEHHAGEFRTQLRMAFFTIAMKRRIAVLQAVEHAQSAPELTLPRFAAALRSEQRDVDDLERELSTLLVGLAHLQLSPPDGLIDQIMMRYEVVELLKWPRRLQELAEIESPAVAGPTDVEIAMVRRPEGSVRVLALVPTG